MRSSGSLLNRATHSVHGTLVSVRGQGILFIGPPDSGKSSWAWALLRRGHRLVSDDVVQIYRSPNGKWWGRAPQRIVGKIEVKKERRIVDVRQVWGATAYEEEMPVDWVVRLCAS